MIYIFFLLFLKQFWQSLKENFQKKSLYQKLNLWGRKFCIKENTTCFCEHLTENMKLISSSFKKLAETMKDNKKLKFRRNNFTCTSYFSHTVQIL